MSGSIAKKLRVGIIDKLVEFDCYIDNELPDYIMVLIANKKTSSQMREDLSLFVGDHVNEFVDWLHYCLDQVKLGNDPFLKAIDKNEPIDYVDEATVLKEESLSKVNSLSKINSSSKIANNQQTGITCKSNSSNEESKENSKKKSLKKEITFTNEDKNNSIRIDQTAVTKDKSIDEQPKRIYNRIIFNSDEKKDDLPVKKIKNTISLNSNTPKSIILTSSVSTSSEPTRSVSTRSHVSSRLAIPSTLSSVRSTINPTEISSHQHSANNYASNRPARINLNSQITHNQSNSKNQPNLNYRKSFADLPSTQYNISSSNQQQFSSNHSDSFNNDGYSHPNLKQFGDLRESMKRKEVHQLESIKTKSQKSMIFKAMEEANKSSNLTSISLRKESDKTKASLINRLGIGSTEQTTANETNNKAARTEVIRKEKRLLKFKPDQEQLIVEEKKLIDNKITEADTINSTKEDLRLQLRKRKLSGDSKVPKRSFVKLVTINSAKNDSDEELRMLKDKIKPKSQVIAVENSKKNLSKSDDDEVNVIIKQELLQKLNDVQAQLIEQKSKLRMYNKDVQTTRKERCPSWPLCKNQEKCQYHHPKMICVQFPACKFGSACLNIHPNCKFDNKCTKVDCPYTHLTRNLMQTNKSTLHLSTIQKIPQLTRRNV